MSSGRAALLGSSTPNWVLHGASVDLNFTTGQHYMKGANGPLSCSRSSVGLAQDLSGNWHTFQPNVLRITNNGLLIEEPRTNSIRNNSMAGAVVGTPGTLPTNWTPGGTTNGVTISVTGLTTINGLPCITLSFVGTPTASFGLSISPEISTIIPAAYGQTWTISAFASVTNLTNVGPSTGLAIYEITSGGSGIAQYLDGSTYPLSAMTRRSMTHTVMSPLAAYVFPQYQFHMQSGLPVNFSVTIGMPQLELNPLVNSTVASAVTAASGSGGVNGTGVYSVVGGNGVAATLNCTWTAGILTVNSVAGGGNYVALTTSPATLTYVSGTATGWTGATVTLTPTNEAAQGFATSPIATSSGMATRAADTVTISMAEPLSKHSLYAIGTPTAPVGYTQGQVLVALAGASGYNILGRNAGGASPANAWVYDGTHFQGIYSAASWVSGAAGKSANLLDGANLSLAFNNAAPVTGAYVYFPSGAFFLSIGGGTRGGAMGASYFNGYIARVAFSPASLLAY